MLLSSILSLFELQVNYSRVNSSTMDLENVLVAKTGNKGKTLDGKPCWVLNDITSYDIDDEGIFKKT